VINSDLSAYEVGNHRIACPQCGRGERNGLSGQPLFIVSSYGRTREFKDLVEVEKWLAVVSGAKP
jgi:hypothetical protein